MKYFRSKKNSFRHEQLTIKSIECNCINYHLSPRHFIPDTSLDRHKQSSKHPKSEHLRIKIPGQKPGKRGAEELDEKGS